MPKFLFQPDPIDGYEFNPIPIDIHLGIIKIPTEEILDDYATNNTESIIVGTERKEVLNRIQTTFAREFQRYGKLKESDIIHTDYATKQAWNRIRKHIKNTGKYD
jgi:pentose-5-phosphate-3-epimerase